ncbi:MAG: flavodoxin family protein [Pseudonocardiaceae bacterium]
MTQPRYDDLKALFINCTLKRSPEPSNTAGLVEVSTRIMEKHAVQVEVLRAIDHDIATGVWPDMTEHGWASDTWPEIYQKVLDGVKHCAMNVLYSLQHLGYTIPPQADSGWIGEAGPGPSYLDPGSGGPDNDFTNRNTTFMTWNLMHLARLLKDAGGIPVHGNQRSEWDAGCRFDFENPEYR